MHVTEFELKPSRFYTSLLGLFLSVSIGIVITLNLNGYFKVMLGLAVAWYGLRLIYRVGLLQAPEAIQRIKRDADKNWYLANHTEVFKANLRGDSTVTRWVSILRFDVEGKPNVVSCVVFIDSMLPSDYRRLRQLVLSGSPPARG